MSKHKIKEKLLYIFALSIMFPLIAGCRIFGYVFIYAIDNHNVWLAKEKDFIKFMQENEYYYSIYQDKLFRFVTYDAREKHCQEFKRHYDNIRLSKKIDDLLK